MLLQILTLLGSLAMFVYGISLMSGGLQIMAGNRLRVFMAKMTSNTFKCILTGIVVTAMVQSSMATTLLIVSFVNAGTLAEFEEAMEYRGGIVRFDPIQRVDHRTVQDGAHLSFVLFEDSGQRSDIRALGCECQTASFHPQVPDFAVGDSPEKTALVRDKFGDGKAFDGTPVAVQDTLESMSPPLTGSKFVIGLIFTYGNPIGHAGQVDISIKDIPAIKIVSHGIQFGRRADQCRGLSTSIRMALAPALR